jgi:spermidine synthase
MARQFEELDFRPTPIGDISLRRRHEPRINRDVFEIKLGDEFLMSSIITDSEIALANLGIEACTGDQLDVAVGGLGLGYTAQAVLAHSHVGTLLVIDYLQAVIEWHQTGLLPLGQELNNDPRCTFMHGDFFALANSSEGFDPTHAGRKFDAILVDIDHSPEALLDSRSDSFYTPAGFTRLAAHLKPNGIFGLWSDDNPDPEITRRLATAFSTAWAEPITFSVPMRETPFTQTVYLARKATG